MGKECKNFASDISTYIGALLESTNIQNIAKVGDFPDNGVAVYNKTTRAMLKNVKYSNNVLGYGLSLLSGVIDSYDYSNGTINGNQYSWRVGTNITATGVGMINPLYGAAFLVGFKSLEMGYDIFVDPKGPIWSNVGSWIPTSEIGIYKGLGGR